MQLMRIPTRWFGIPRRGFFVLSLALLLIMTVQLVQARSMAQSVPEGQALFQEKCTGCHTIGQGDKVGPDLAGVVVRRDRAWLVRWLSAPDRMVAQGDPIAVELLQKYNRIQMPNFGLSDSQVAALIAYPESQAEGASAPPAAAPQPSAVVPGGSWVKSR